MARKSTKNQESWETPAAISRATRAFKRFVKELQKEHSLTNYDQVAELLEMGGQSTISHLANGKHKVGPTALMQLIRKGYDPTEIFPEHPISELWKQAQGTAKQPNGEKFSRTRKVPILSLNFKEISAYLQDGKFSIEKKLPLVDSQKLASRTFVVMMPDESLNNVTMDPLVPPGYSVFFDPDLRPRSGDPVLAITDDREVLIRSFENKNSLVATTSGHGGNIESFTVLAVGYYAVMDF